MGLPSSILRALSSAVTLTHFSVRPSVATGKQQNQHLKSILWPGKAPGFLQRQAALDTFACILGEVLYILSGMWSQQARCVYQWDLENAHGL